MGRPPVIPLEKKTRIVLAVLAGESSIAEGLLDLVGERAGEHAEEWVRAGAALKRLRSSAG